MSEEPIKQLTEGVNPKPQTPDPTKADWEYVTIPEIDLYDQPHPSLWNNRKEFKPGTHLVPPDLARSLKDRLSAFDESQRRIYRGTSDRKTVRQIGKGGITNFGG